MIEFMGITPGPAKNSEKPEEEDEGIMHIQARFEDARSPDFESLYNEAMQQLRQRDEMLDDAAFVIAAMEARAGAVTKILSARHDISAASDLKSWADRELENYRDTIEALRKRTEIPF